MIRCCTVPEIWCVTDGRMDEQMDGRTESDIEVGDPSKNCTIIHNVYVVYRQNKSESVKINTFRTE